ncbi:DUF4214 domain-containing protein [Duganella sp. FT109W]|uniref:DUF4214 domain-containing protein n=1 Tax=Duganella margarita TaxID=2692170 RepID=A0ABW9WR35_9BURK|nr:DUF4214 domain-containing protein [Duganella margarita]MYN43395.1 DUF4214 domain-containing protein [Duganella margarita]
MGLRAAQGAVHTLADYTPVIQRLYLGFFGRPADAGGLPFWQKQFSDANLPLTTAELSQKYAGNADIRRIVDAFATSQEAQELNAGSNAVFVNSVYLNVFNRQAELDGLSFWTGFLDRKELTRSQVLLWIAGSAQGTDVAVAANKLAAATYFTAALDLPQEGAAYSGANANLSTRALLAAIDGGTDMVAFNKQIDDFIAALITPNQQTSVKRYSGYRYLQDMVNTPAYSAYYSYAGGGVVSPATAGTVTYGVLPLTVNWSRNATTRELVYAAPVVASVGLPAAATWPEVTMLCTSEVTPDGSSNKSTDVLVALSATQLTDAAQLAGQTLSVYRENCVTGGSRVTSFSFDASGNGSFPTSAGLLTLNAAAVTSVLNGQQLPDASTGKWLTFTAYRYTRSDNSTGYMVLQHLGDKTTGLTNGALATWSQE